MTIETWLFVTAVVTAMFLAASVLIFLADMIYDKWTRK